MVRIRLFLAVFILFSLGMAPFSQPVTAAGTIVVTTTLDAISNDGLCSLREAVIAANTNAESSNCPAGSPGEDTIVFDASISLPAVFTLTLTGQNENYAASGDLDVRESLIITGAGAANTIFDGNTIDRIFEVHPGSGAINKLTINGATIQHGNPGNSAQGGGILVNLTGRLTVNNSVISGNSASTCAVQCGGGIKSLGVVAISDSSVTANQGGGIHNDGGLLTLTNVTTSDNSLGVGVANLNKGYLTYNGGIVSNNQGGGIYNKNATAQPLTSLTISGNSNGGGIKNESSSAINLSQIQLSNSVVASNSGTSGGGILNQGSGAKAVISNTTIRDNSAASNGGGINNTGLMTVTTSTIDHNQATAGGGIDHNGSSLSLTNVTISQNIATDNGGGLYNRSSTTLLNVTIHGNSAGGPDTGGNIFNDGDTSTLIVKNAIVSGNDASGNCANNFGIITSQGNNLESADSCGFSAAGDLKNTDPLLTALQDNGGLTKTHMLNDGSPAIDGGTNTGCPATDQRGVSRPLGLKCDIGAVETGGNPLAADVSVMKVDNVDPVLTGMNIVYTLTIVNHGPDSASNVVMTDELPAGLLYVSSSTDQGSCGHNNGTITCNLGVLVNFGQAVIQIVTKTLTFGEITNLAVVNSSTNDSDLTNNSSSQVTVVIPYRVFLPSIQTNH